MPPIAPPLPTLPLVGRGSDLAAIGAAVERARAGRGAVIWVTGEGGVGKTRVVGALARELRRAGWTVMEGRAYAVETGVPFAVFADALVPFLAALPEGALTRLARGAEAGLMRLFPALSGRPLEAPDPTGGETDSRTQLFWSVAQVLRGIAERAPLLVVLDDLHWSDRASLELLHFLARQTASAPIVLLGTINEDERSAHPSLRDVERSLATLQLATECPLQPLERAAVDELLHETFGVASSASGPFARALWERTRGNPLLIDATLSDLVERGGLRKEGATWLGWESSTPEPPRSVREALLSRLERLPASARTTAEAIAVIGARARVETLRELTELPADELIAALETLVRSRIVTEESVGRSPVYNFRHPLAREVVFTGIGRARRAMLHARAAAALERAFGAAALDHADELAFHFSHADLQDAPAQALPYLAAAGRSALARFADREAVEYLQLALERAEASRGAGSDPPSDERLALMEDLGRALRRVGDDAGAAALWERAVSAARGRGDDRRSAGLLRRIGVAHFLSGRYGTALAAYDEALALARAAGDERLLGGILVPRGMCLQGLGRVAEAERDLSEALQLAESSGDAALRARTHRALLLFHTWSGPADRARAHGRAAIALAEETGDLALASSCHAAQAALEGLAGHAPECAHHLAAAERLNDRIGSPLVGLAIAEVQVEYAFGSGDWDTALAVGERAIGLGHALSQQALLPRLLVWTALVHLGRDDTERAGAYLAEAWHLSGADAPDDARDVHSVVPAHIGIASRHVALGELDEAVAVARAALAIVDRTGYRTWASHRLLPVLAEAHLIARDLDGARAVGERLRREATDLADPLAEAWADACDAVVLWLGGAGAEAAHALRGAAEKLEAVPFIPDALRLRRRLAACLADIGDREGAVSELRRVHEGFARLGAERELEKTRRALHDVGARPPARGVSAGAGGLTGRERQIVDLVAARKSNKAIGKELDISARTVETHLANIFKKLEVGSRAELVEVARSLPPEPR